VEGLRLGSVRMTEKCECPSLYQNITGPDLPKTTLETDRILIALNIDPIKSCFIKNDLHMTAHFRSKGAERILQLYAENGHENILADEEIFTTEKKYNNRTTRFIVKSPLR